jgi:hypothetical protein
MAAVAETEFFSQRLQDNPSNRERLLAMDVQEFCTVMRRWATAFTAPNPVSDLSEEQLKTIACPMVIFAGNTPDEVHHKSAAEAVHRLVPHAELRPSAWTHQEWDVIEAATTPFRDCRHEPLRHEGHVLCGGVARLHRQDRRVTAKPLRIGKSIISAIDLSCKMAVLLCQVDTLNVCPWTATNFL